VRNKLAAILLGSAGIGLIGLYQTLTSLVESTTNLGLASSGVRELAAARGRGDEAGTSFVSSVLRRSAWILGSVGWLLMAILSVPLSVWAFNKPDHFPEISALGGLVLLGSLTGARNAILQGNQRLRELALVGILSSALGAALSIFLYWLYGDKGIIPSLLGTALIGFGIASFFSHKIPTRHADYDWSTYWKATRGLASLGIAFMLGGILMAIVAVITRGLIIRQLGIEANGLYQAAWGLAGMFAGFILNAMALDFFPRLSAVADDNVMVNRLVNEQTEIGVLLALPGLVGTLAFAPWILHLFYSAEFLPASQLLVGLFLGCFAQVIGWPLGFVPRAKSALVWVVGSESALILFHLILTIALLPRLGLMGVALAFTLFYFSYILVMWAVARHLSGFRWSQNSLRLIGVAVVLVLFTASSSELLETIPARILGALTTIAACLFSARGIAVRLGQDHRLVQLLSRLPGWRLLQTNRT